MTSFLVTSFIGLVAAGTIFKILAWRSAYGLAKSTKFPVFLSPVHLTNIWWLMFYPFLVPFLNLIPSKWKTPWLPMAQLWNIWKFGYTPFQDAGTDTFILSTPDGNLLWTCDPQVCHQLETQHSKSQVDVDMVKFYQLYGPNVGSVEGVEWKMHRSVIAAGFTPTTNASVWKVTTEQTNALVDCWLKKGSRIATVKEWMSRLALHVISGVFFNKHMTWNEHSQNVSEPPPPGHQLHYDQAIFTVLARLGTLYITPKALLAHLPMNAVREADTAFTEWTKYMQELSAEVINKLEEVASKKNKNVLESILLAGTPGSKQIGDRSLPEASILGNIFFILLAGHETTGNTMAFVLNLLAVFPEYQRKIQEDLDRQVKDRPQEEWTVEREYQIFQKGWIGAVTKEVLRLYCVVQFIPRIILEDLSVVDSKGATHIIPKKTLCLLNFAAAFRNPNTWSQSNVSTERREELHNSPALDFDPSRWVNDTAITVDCKDGSAPILFPFGQGPHYCPGRLFAQVEMTAALATILMDYSLELEVDEQTKQSCGGNETLAWEKTRDNALKLLVDGIESNVSIQLLKELPIKVVKRSG